MALLVALTALFASSCIPRRAGPDPVRAGEWCDTFGETMCLWVHDNCAQGAAVPPSHECAEGYARACLRSRPRTSATGRSYDELNACVDYIEELNCPELGITHVDPMGFMRVDHSGLPAELRTLCAIGD